MGLRFPLEWVCRSCRDGVCGSHWGEPGSYWYEFVTPVGMDLCLPLGWVCGSHWDGSVAPFGMGLCFPLGWVCASHWDMSMFPFPSGTLRQPWATCPHGMLSWMPIPVAPVSSLRFKLLFTIPQWPRLTDKHLLRREREKNGCCYFIVLQMLSF